MCRRKIDGEVILDGHVFFLDGQEIFRAAEGTRHDWQKWEQLWVHLGDSWSAVYMRRGYSSKKDWGYGSKSTWKSSRRDIRWNSAERRREDIARDKAEKGKK